MIDPELIALAAAVVAGTGGAARVGTKSVLNGIYKRLDRHEDKIDAHGEKINAIAISVAKLEAKHE